MVHFRFDGVGQSMSKLGISDRKKVDPTFKKCETASEVVIQLLLAACSGDVRSLQRLCWETIAYLQIQIPIDFFVGFGFRMWTLMLWIMMAGLLYI